MNLALSRGTKVPKMKLTSFMDGLEEEGFQTAPPTQTRRDAFTWTLLDAYRVNSELVTENIMSSVVAKSARKSDALLWDRLGLDEVCHG